MIFRSIIFEIVIALLGMMIPIIYCAAFFSKNGRKIADQGALTWSKLTLFALKKICNIDYEVRGLENLPKEGGFIVACKHQSAWETVVMNMIFDRPAYAYKKELLKIPFYGWFLGKMSGISVDRKGGASSMKNLIKQSKDYLNRGQKIIIFPQGTRVPVGKLTSEYPYQPGIKALYSHLDFPIVPAVLNSGKYWSKSKINKLSGKIVLQFLPPIENTVNKKEFLTVLEDTIENGSNKLLAEHN